MPVGLGRTSPVARIAKFSNEIYSNLTLQQCTGCPQCHYSSRDSKVAKEQLWPLHNCFLTTHYLLQVWWQEASHRCRVWWLSRCMWRRPDATPPNYRSSQLKEGTSNKSQQNYWCSRLKTIGYQNKVTQLSSPSHWLSLKGIVAATSSSTSLYRLYFSIVIVLSVDIGMDFFCMLFSSFVIHDSWLITATSSIMTIAIYKFFLPLWSCSELSKFFF